MELPTIPFNRASTVGSELSYVGEAVHTGCSAAKGPFSNRAAHILKSALGAKEVLLTTSCTSALEMSAMLLRLKPGENVILPSYTFVSTASAFARSGAELRFADIDPTTLCIDPRTVFGLVDDATRAIVPVHYAGISSDIKALMEIADSHELIAIIEDNAHGLFGYLEGKALGSFGRFAALSFHETKNFSCGEGGALIINRSEDIQRANVIYDKGTNRESFLSGQVDRYTWIDEGSSFGLSDLLAAFLLGQLENRTKVMARRRQIFNRYSEGLAPFQNSLGYSIPAIPEKDESGYHMFYVLLADPERRERVLEGLEALGVKALFHYQPLHRSLGARKWISRDYHCPVSDSISDRIVRLPFFYSMKDGEIDYVTDSLVRVLESVA